MRPVSGSRVRPPGNRPEVIDQVYGGAPPVAPRVTEYGLPWIPSGRLVVVMLNGKPASIMVSVRLAVADWAGAPESVTIKVSGVAATAAVGVPLIVPAKASNVKPAGRFPEINCQLTAPVAPLAARVAEYAVPTAPSGSEVVVMVNGGPGTIVSVRLAVADCTGVPESLTINVSGVAFTLAVGVPLIVPLDAFRVSPAGKIPEVTCHI